MKVSSYRSKSARREPSHILISFCNVVAGAPTLALLDVATGEVRVLRVSRQFSELGGIAGLAVSERFVYAMTQRSNPVGRAAQEVPGTSCLVIFDRDDLSVRSEYVCSSVVDAHSICVVDDELYVVSTGTDEVVRLVLRNADVVAEETFWRPERNGPHADLHHMNAVHYWHRDLLVSGFGKKTGSQWSSAKEGFIVNISTGERPGTDIYHPHSMLGLDCELVYCESSTRTIRALGTERCQELPGYARGLCRVGEALFVGTSKGRRVSKSTGELTNRGDPGELAGRCTVTQVAADNFEVRRVAELDRFGWEVYDLAAVSDVAAWPILDEVEWRDDTVRGLRESFEERDATISWLHVEVAKRDDAVAGLQSEASELHERAAGLYSEVEQLHDEVASRDGTIGQLREELVELHTRFAEQHRTIEWLHHEVAQRDGTIETLQAEISQRDGTLDRLHGEVADRDRRIRQLEARVPGNWHPE